MIFSIIKMLFCKNKHKVHKNELDITYHSNTGGDNAKKSQKKIHQLSPDQIILKL